MKHCKRMLIMAFFMTSSMLILHAQDGEKMRDRLKAYKKIMLMEKLELNEEQSIKFFSRYNAQEESIKKAKVELNQAIDILEQTVNSGKGDVEKTMQLVFEKDMSMRKTVIDRIKSMKNVLSEKQYAKYVLIEYRLLDDVKKAIKKKRK